MDLFYKIVALLGGLSMFLYGMRIMGDGLKQSSGGAMKIALGWKHFILYLLFALAFAWGTGMIVNLLV